MTPLQRERLGIGMTSASALSLPCRRGSNESLLVDRFEGYHHGCKNRSLPNQFRYRLFQWSKLVTSILFPHHRVLLTQISPHLTSSDGNSKQTALAIMTTPNADILIEQLNLLIQKPELFSKNATKRIELERLGSLASRALETPEETMRRVIFSVSSTIPENSGIMLSIMN
jgi:hypothetical protein